MHLSDPATLRFIYRFLRPVQPYPGEREVLIEVEGEPRAATVYLPRAGGRRTPAWIILHGVTVPGRHHAAARRMGGALAAAGHLALVPEVPSWRALDVNPRETEPTVRAGLEALSRWRSVSEERVGLMGFSVAATWGLEAAAGPFGDRFRSVVAMGGYADMERTVRAMILGEHEWRGREYGYRPDPYGRWIIGGSLLPLLRDGRYGNQKEREVTATALRELAVTAGRNGALADEPIYDRLISDVRGRLPAGGREAWDILARQSDAGIADRQAGRALAATLADAAIRTYPELDPRGRLDGLRVEPILMHGRVDRLIPFTETLRLAAMLPKRVEPMITRLMGHTKPREAELLANPAVLAAEAWRLAEVMDRILHSVDER